MASIPAKLVGEKVLESLGKKKKPNLGKIAREVGYADNTADNPLNITETKSYKDVVNPVIEQYQKLREKIISEMNRKGRKLSKEKLIALTTALKNTTHDIQLLTGGKTENNGMGELAEKLNDWINSKK